MTMPKENSNIYTEAGGKTAISPDNSNRLAWRILWGLTLLILLFCLVSLLVWLNRARVAKWSLKTLVLPNTIEAEFDIKSLSLDAMEIKSLQLSQNNKVFLTTDKLKVTYDWEGLKSGKINHISVTDANITAEIDARGKLIAPHFSAPASGSNEDLAFPKDGIMLQKGTISLKTPFGEMTLKGDIDAPNRLIQSGSINLTTAGMSWRDVSADPEGPVTFNRDGDTLQTQYDIKAKQARYGALRLQAPTLTGETEISLGNDHKAQTQTRLDFTTAHTPDYKAQTGHILFDGNVAYTDAISLDGQWGLSVEKAGFTNAERRSSLANTLGLRKTLNTLSVTAPFADKVPTLLEAVLEESDLSGQGQISLKDGQTRLSLSSPLTMTHPDYQLALKSAPGVALYNFDKKSRTLTSSPLDLTVTGLMPLSAEELTFAAQSQTGRTIETLSRLSGTIHSPKTWYGKTKNGRPARLAPFRYDVSYTQKDGLRQFSLSGALDYDGDIPGGYVRGAKGSGTVFVSMKDQNHSVKFSSDNPTIRLDYLESLTDWIAEDMQIDLSAEKVSYQRRGRSSHLFTPISRASGQITHIDGSPSLTFQTGPSDITGKLSTGKQVWRMNATQAAMQSDTIPGPETNIHAPILDFTAVLEKTKPLQIDVSSPNVRAETTFFKAKDLSVKASGTPDDLSVTYDDGLIQFTATDFPPLPMSGQVDFANDIWQGTALTRLPKAGETPVDVSYQFSEGKGSATVLINDLAFTRRGLQPQTLFPTLSGKIADVEGLVDAKILLEFSAGEPMRSKGSATLKDMSLGTLPGPVTGLNTELQFSSFFPLQSQGIQTLTLGQFDPGFPLENGEIAFEIIPDGAKIHSAKWPLGQGKITLDPTTWLYSSPSNQMTLRVSAVDIGRLLESVGNDSFKATGILSGELPIEISGVNVTVKDGFLAIKDGGTIQYQSQMTDAAGDNNVYAGYAFDALKDFHYKELEARLDGPLDGLMMLKLVFEGSNPSVLNDSPFLFRVGVEGELLNIARSFNIGPQISAEIVRQIEDQQDK